MHFMPQQGKEVNCIQFPYKRSGELVNVKYRDGAKNFCMVKDAERILFGWDDLFKEDGTLHEWCIFVEGEIDKLSFEVIGIKQCISVPDGAPAVTAKNYSSKFSFLESSMDTLLKLERIYIAVDSDSPGLVLEQELVRRLGAERCIKITFPEGCKDANDVLQKHGPDELWNCFRNAKPFPIAGVIAPMDLASEVRNLYERGIYQLGIETGWNNLSSLYRPTAGQMTIITAMPGAGKTEVIDALLTNIAQTEGWRFALFSPEAFPHSEHIVRLIMKYENAPFYAGFNRRMELSDMELALAWVNEHFRFIDLGEQEPPTLDNILAKAEYLVRSFGINGLVIDPYNELDHARSKVESETEYISRFLARLRRFTRTNGIHTWLVAHPTKLPKVATNKKNPDGTPIMTYGVPTPYDISGSAHFRNKADVCIALHRDQIDGKNITEIHVQKMRFARCGKLGIAYLKWDSVTGRFVPAESQQEEYAIGF